MCNVHQVESVSVCYGWSKRLAAITSNTAELYLFHCRWELTMPT